MLRELYPLRQETGIAGTLIFAIVCSIYPGAARVMRWQLRRSRPPTLSGVLSSRGDRFVVSSGSVIVNDVMAYTCGKLFGRTPLTVLSPKKTRLDIPGPPRGVSHDWLDAPPVIPRRLPPSSLLFPSERILRHIHLVTISPPSPCSCMHINILGKLYVRPEPFPCLVVPGHVCTIAELRARFTTATRSLS